MTLERSNTLRPFKILLIGDSSVGKTSIMFRFADDKFSESFTPTIGIDFKIKTIIQRGKTIRLQLWDTAGQEKFFNITRSYYRNADAIVLVYDRTEASSFQHVARWMKSIEENAPDDVLRILVGNKSDLHHRLVISAQEGKKLAETYRIDYFETSAKSDTSPNVTKMFQYLIDKLLDLQQPHAVSNINLPNDQEDGIQQRLSNCC